MSKGAYVRAWRICASVSILSALAVQAWADLTFGHFSWDQMPGYFTPLAAITGVLALLTAAAWKHPNQWWIDALRVNAATYTSVAAVVYWAVLADHAVPKVPWANAMLHGGAAFILLADWVFLGRRRRLPLRTWWTVLLVPGGWCAYLVIRAAYDGWIPYPFLDPARGPAAITGTIAAIAAVGLAWAAVLHVFTFLRRDSGSVSAPATEQIRQRR